MARTARDDRPDVHDDVLVDHVVRVVPVHRAGRVPGTSATGSPIRSEDSPAAVWSLKEPWTETVDPRMAELLASLCAWMPAEESRRGVPPSFGADQSRAGAP